MAAVARPKLLNTGRRPSSAIFLGGHGNAPPALPEPPRTPSPEEDYPDHSGLPSPPATVSTGSNEGTANGGSVRLRSPPPFVKDEQSSSPDDMATQRSRVHRPRSRSRSRSRPAISAHESSWRVDDEDEVDEADELANDEDHTARFNVDRRRSMPADATLQRIRDLNERSRMVMDKLTSRSRVSTPSPSHVAKNQPARSPLPPPTSTTSSPRKRSPHSTVSRSRIFTSRTHETVLSGSETERESTHSHSNSFSSGLSDADTPPTAPSAWPPHGGSMRNRQRRGSVPSPGNTRSRSVLRGAILERDVSPSPSQRTPRKRPSTSMSVHERDRSHGDVSMESAGSYTSHRAPTTLGRKSRQPLPSVFYDQDSQDEANTSNVSRVSLDRDNSTLYARGSPSPSGMKTPDYPRPPRAGTLAAKSSTVRELTRRHQTRWLSQDLDADQENPEDVSPLINKLGVGRRQQVRGGSAESPLAGYALGERSFAGEPLRTAGIGARAAQQDGEYSPTTAHSRRAASGGNAPSARSSDQGSNSGQSRPAFTSRRTVTELQPSTSNALVTLRSERSALSRMGTHQSATSARPTTSLADYVDGAPAAPRTAPAHLRTQRSSYQLADREPGPGVVDDRSPRLSRFAELEPTGRNTSFSGARAASVLNGAAASGEEHLQLLATAHGRFEGALAHLPPRGSTTTQTVPDVFRHAQALVRATDKLHGLLADGAQTAMRAHVRATIDDEDGAQRGEDMGALWRAVGAEFREGVRATDELVRVMTEFFLGMGKVLKDVSESSPAPSQHMRTYSVDQDSSRLRGGSPLAALNGRGHGSADGSSVSSGSRKSWTPKERVMRSVQPEGLPSSRSASALLGRRDEREMSIESITPDKPSQTGRKLFTPREAREQSPLVVASDSVETVRGATKFEPSPTPVTRRPTQVALDRQRVLQPLSIPLARPPLLSTLPSESLIQSAEPETPSDDSHHRKYSSTSISTVRATIAPKLAKVVPGSTTTALSPHTVTHSTAPSSFPMLTRADSTPFRRESSVTFSRPSAVSISALAELNGGSAGAAITTRERAAAEAAALMSPASGSETERPPARHRTLGVRSGPRASLDSIGARDDSIIDRAPRHGTVVPAVRKERRKTVTELFTRR